MKSFSFPPALALAVCLTLALPAISLSQHVSFTRHIINSGLEQAFDCFIADIDNDGDNDIAAVAYGNDIVGWWENDGVGNFTTHIISNSYDGAISVYVIDLDSDGDMDILTASFSDDEVGWWRNDGSQNFTYYQIANSMTLVRCIHAADLDLDGDNDVLIAVESLNLIAWFENDGNQLFIQHNIAAALVDPHFVNTADLDNDGDVDILGAYFGAGLIVVWENDGLQNFTQHIIADHFYGPWTVFPMDIDADNDFDILSCAREGNNIGWAENIGGMNFVNHNILCPTGFIGPHDVLAADFDSDNDLDIVSIGSNSSNLAFWRNDGVQNFRFITMQNCNAYPNRIQSGDLDGDSDIDIALVTYAGNTLEWWENTLIDSNSIESEMSQNLAIIPADLKLSVSPNPFNSRTEISFALQKSSQVQLAVYDIQGKMIIKALDSFHSAGTYKIPINLQDFSSGVYFALLKIDEANYSEKLLYIK